MDAFPQLCQVPSFPSVAEFSLHRIGGREDTLREIYL